ncbi:MAG: GAF domain-containing protein, partial [Clostridia bacterium]|nr:GAF domain-containing protein [Clostridia bacterium]
DSGALWLGPFQGKPACVRIEVGKGVCGTAFNKNALIIVPDVHAFPGHIACDSASRSEIVLPLRSDNRPIGVLDIDSPFPGRFTEAEGDALTAIAGILSERCDLSRLSYDLRPAP